MAEGRLIERITDILDQTVVLDPPQKKLVALYVMNSYVYEKFDFCPLLCITAPTKACGKSTLAEVMGILVHKPQMTVNATPAVLFRLIERDKPCLIADETDTWSKQVKQELSYILNGGFSRQNATVLRCIQSGDDIRAYNVYCPKVVVGIGDFLTNTTKSRSLFVAMKRKKASDVIHRLRDVQLMAEQLKEDLIRWAEGYKPTLTLNKTDREGDKLEAIKTIALEQALDISDIDFSGRNDEEDPDDDERLIKGILEVSEGKEYTTVSEITVALNQDERWEDANHGRGITNSQVGRLIRTFNYDTPSRPFRRSGQSQPQRWIHLPTLRANVLEYLDLDEDVTDVTDVTHFGARSVA